MSAYQEETSNEHFICPYCREGNEAGGLFDVKVEMECGVCSRKFYAYGEISTEYTATPCCTLNTQSHVWQPHGVGCDICVRCGKVEERKAHI